MTKREKIIDWFSANRGFAILFAFLLLFLAIVRSVPYFLHGPFGFGYDTGIYKKSFEDIKNFSDIFRSQVYLFPSFLAYLMNVLHIPMGFLLYGVHIFMSIFIAIPLYLLTKQYFGRHAGVLAVALFTVSYVQVFASEFYLFKAVMGAVFMLYAFLYFTRKSNLFYLFAGLLALTQLPQLVLLVFGIAVASLVDWKKNLKFNLIGFWVVICALLLIFVLAPQQITEGWDVVMARLSGKISFDAHQAGLFMPFREFFVREFLLVIFGVLGVAFSVRRKEVLPLIAALIFVSSVVIGKVFFENRFVMEMELLLTPFAAFMIVKTFGKIFVRKYMKIVSVILIVFFVSIYTLFYVSTTYPALTRNEVTAVKILQDKHDIPYVFVTNTTYAPWMYGFSGKEVLAPGIFNSVWNFGEFLAYQQSSKVEKTQKLLNLARKYGPYYYFEGERQESDNLTGSSPFIVEILQLGKARLFTVSNPDLQH
ncbi:MAG: hypothetical protein NTX63_03585 [Candidatus Peregrinibacteria bacterium]|nr:hypothetical protein [Candidatus Peregrinibacteria bacterium]